MNRLSYILKGAKFWNGKNADVVIENKDAKEEVLAFDGCVVFPSFCDVHVHFREPGYEYKETIKTGSLSALAGGYTDVCTMPNLAPCPDSLDNLLLQLDKIKETAYINVHPYASITKGQMGQELSDMEALTPYVAGFTDDGRGIQSEDLMEEAMMRAKSLGKIIVAHCEVNELLRGGYIHDGEYAKKNGHRGICSESEYAQIARDIELAKKTNVKYHVCHISTAESVEIIRQAKKDGVDITCETAPHYLVFSDMDLEDDGRFKMNPPIRSARDRDALIEGIKDGTIDMIATDHAPHSIEEKSKGLEKSVMGVVGLETAFSAMYTHFVKTGVITMERLIELMAVNPRKRFGIKQNDNDYTVFDLTSEYRVNPDEFLSKGRSTPFSDKKLFGRCVATFCAGEPMWRKK